MAGSTDEVIATRQPVSSLIVSPGYGAANVTFFRP
ncbi:hypothetical protein M2105_001563 [Paenibacillus sp. PastF-1]|nr:hypothetical protein [Paenibacillus sp. PastF-2]MDF9847146.1 hypothetical protein [Paenibacillus sp. PastM-2]MDF9853718.1 hypothetical protein [Paenibacillus sp. PastF-1]MDH6478796.1 hypothetical protein [Paenibacillus sp. PastH-2]MDH6506528.1 hypothetical protein [Paenibacillus sp. PastM-3]